MGEQLKHLEEMAVRPNVFVQVLPNSVRNNPGIEGQLRVLHFPDSPPAWYTEGWYAGRMSESPSEVDTAITNFDLIRTSTDPGTRRGGEREAAVQG